jgi:hypothetical protein
VNKELIAAARALVVAVHEHSGCTAHDGSDCWCDSSSAAERFLASFSDHKHERTCMAIREALAKLEPLLAGAGA